MSTANKIANLPVETSSQDVMLALRNSVYPGAKDESINLVLSYCRAAGLDPLQKPVHIVPMWDKNAGAMRDVVMPGIGLYRTQASRSGQYAGVTEPEFGEDVTETLGGVEITYPKWCKVTVKRVTAGGQIVEFTAKEFWKENYALKGGKEKSIAPNAMWLKRPYGQIAKCAEAQALRKAFPEFGAQPTAEEMEGKSIDTGDAEIVRQDSVTMPRAKSQTAEREPIDIEPTHQAPVAASKPLSDGMLRVIRAKANAAGITETEIAAHFKAESLEALTVDVNAVLAFLASPGG